MDDFLEKPLSQQEFIELEPQQQKQDNFGLAISGGGIRSATFALGVIQSLAKTGILKNIDYLSTVSGGGYIGTWLSLWVQREKDGLNHVASHLPPPPDNLTDTSRLGAEAQQIQWLRKYSNFLAPVTGFFSADTWLIFTIWSRNTLLNLLVLIPFLAALLLAPWVYLSYLITPIPIQGLDNSDVLLIASLGTLVGAVVSYQLLRRKALERGVVPALLVCLFSVLFAKSFLVSQAASAQPFEMQWLVGIAGALAGAFCCIGMWTNRPRRAMSFISRAVLCALVSAVGLVGMHWMGQQWIEPNPKSLAVLIFCAPLLSSACSVLLILIIGTLGPLTRDEDREGLSRVTAWIGIFSIAGLLLNSIASYGPILLGFLYQAGQLFYATGGLWALISGLGAYFAQSTSTSGKDPSRATPLERVLPLSSYVFVIGLLFAISLGLHLLLANIGNLTHLSRTITTPQEIFYCDSCRQETAPVDWGPLWTNTVAAMQEDTIALGNSPEPILALLIAFALFLVLSRLLHINEFSMFSFYKNRLVRAYCAASRPQRSDQDDLVPFTNLAYLDDAPLMPDPETSKANPFTHIINTAANISLEETGLAERRAVSFAFTPYGCGYRLPSTEGAYRAFESSQESVSYGTAMTISGAAASPNMGFHTSPVLAFLMTVFNVRLGYWFWNPGKEALVTKHLYGLAAKLAPNLRSLLTETRLEALRKSSSWQPKGPKWGTFYFISELFALANKRRKYIYLSDGGHFENLAVYELLARRVKFIICIDGEEDPKLKFEGLGGLVRKAQQDFGVRIRIDTSDIEERSENGWSRSHCTVGCITYPNDAEPGYLVYIKLSVTGDESQDILTYRKLNPAFPHQSTADQFFNESQFESYRRLGYHVGNISFLGNSQQSRSQDERGLKAFFENLYDSWQPIPRAIRDHFTESNRVWDEYMKELQTRPELAKLARQFSSDQTHVEAISDQDPDHRACAMYCLRLIQFMENVFFDLQLSATLSHPAIKGWQKQFELWFQSQLLCAVYQREKAIFSKTFTVFCDAAFQPKRTD